jgi:hypothetical protein
VWEFFEGSEEGRESTCGLRYPAQVREEGEEKDRTHAFRGTGFICWAPGPECRQVLPPGAQARAQNGVWHSVDGFQPGQRDPCLGKDSPKQKAGRQGEARSC